MTTSSRSAWLVLIPTVLGAGAMLVVASSAPKRFRSEAAILVIPPQVPQEYVVLAPVESVAHRVQGIRQEVLSRTRLERLITDQNLYPAERATESMDDVTRQMRSDISFSLGPRPTDPIGSYDGFRVSYVSSDAATAHTVTAILASLVIDAHLRDRELLAEGTLQFLEVQLQEFRRRLAQAQTAIDVARSKGASRAEITAAMLDDEAAQSTYRALLAKQAQAEIATNLERRQIGEQFKVLDPAGPGTPVDLPNRRAMALNGALGGFAIGLVLALFAGIFWRRTPAAVLQARIAV